MSGLVQTTPDDLCNLVRWAHSHGTICSIIPVLRRRARGSCGNSVRSESGAQGGNVPVLEWGCDSGHAYYWPLSTHGSMCAGSANISQERHAGGHRANKVAMQVTCDLSSHERASEGECLSILRGDSSALDDNGDYEPPPSRKRSVTPGMAASSGRVAGKRVKQEATSAEDVENAAQTACTGHVNTHFQIAQTLCSKPQRPGTPPEVFAEDAGCEGLVDSDMELLAGGSCTTGTTENTEKTAAVQSELEELRVLLSAERNRNQQMTEMISSLKQDKELLQQELTKKAELICDFLQDKLRPERRWPHCSNQTEPGSSCMPSSDDAEGFDSPTQFDSFEEIEIHPLERHRNLKSKRNRDGENTRVRMKNVVGVIARYMAALQEFRRSVSMKVAFDRVGVDRNTISRTAAIAELSLAAPEVFHTLAPWDEKEETLARYALRCRQAMDDNIKAKIKAMKAKGELLPIVSK